MKKFLVLCMIFLLISSLYAMQTLTVYTYDSFVSGMAKIIGPIFEKEYHCKVNFLSFGDSGNLLSRLVLEKSHPSADVAIGISQSQLPKALSENIFIPYKPTDLASITNKKFLVDKSFRLIPFDYGALAIDYNIEKIKNPPKSFKELLSSRFKNSLVIEDPRTSGTGLDFLLWTIALHRKDWQNFWKELLPSVKTITSGWGSAFDMLEKGEAPMMVSFATDRAYNYYYYKKSKIGVVIPSEGAYVMVEYAGIVKGTRHLKLAKDFMNFILSKSFQSAVPLNQWMYPVTNVKLPAVYQYAPKVTKIVTLSPEEIEKNLSKWLEEWTYLIVR